MIYLDACRGLTHIGRLGENEHRTVRFQESAAVLAMYPEASVTVLHKRPGDPAAYPVAPGYVTIESGIVCWTIQSGDLATVGRGQAEVVFTSGGVIAKSLIYDTMIDKALDGAGDPPEPWESWVGDVSAEANRAESAAEDAKEWATGLDKNGNPVPPTDKHYEKNAEYYAGQAGQSAQSAQQVLTQIESAGTTQIGLVNDAGAAKVTAVNEAGAAQIQAVGAKGAEVLESIPSDYSAMSDAIDAAPTEATGQDLLEVLLMESGLTEGVLEVIGRTFTMLPSDETAVDIRNALSLEADRLAAIYDLWLAEKEGA